MPKFIYFPVRVFCDNKDRCLNRLFQVFYSSHNLLGIGYLDRVSTIPRLANQIGRQQLTPRERKQMTDQVADPC